MARIPPVTETMRSEFARCFRLAREARLPDIFEGTSYGTPAIRTKRKAILRMKEEGVAVLMCPLDKKEVLIEASPDIYFETAHYNGWPAFLIRLANIGDDELAHRLVEAWKENSTAKIVAAFEAGSADRS